jgi:hypothetical protein
MCRQPSRSYCKYVWRARLNRLAGPAPTLWEHELALVKPMLRQEAGDEVALSNVDLQ